MTTEGLLRLIGTDGHPALTTSRRSPQGRSAGSRSRRATLGSFRERREPRAAEVGWS